MSRAGLEKKVRDYLRKYQALESCWQQPIASGQLQAEIDRIARDTKQSALLRELFEALDNDPFVIAECLCRPTLVDRYLSVGCLTKARDELPNQNDGFAYTLPEISAVKAGANNTWTATTNVNAPDVRFSHTALWTGSEMIIWAGENLSQARSLNTGARYTPATDSWAITSVTGAPLDRYAHTAVWTGTDMIVWGGSTASHPAGPLNSGARYNPVTDAWIATATTNAPVARSYHTATWTGSEMIVWGGRDNVSWMNSGGRYDPRTDTWSATNTINAAAARWNHDAAWTGSEMIVWGGTDQTNYLHTGGRYNPRTDSWTPTSLANVPLGRIAFTAIWTGSEMIVWGGVDETFHAVNIGGRYNPGTDSWVTLNLPNTPSARDSHTAVWTGSEMIIWGGSGPSGYFNTGGRYNPGANSWTSTTTLDAPMARAYHTAVWTGDQMIVWGGSNDAGYFLSTGGSYSAQPSTPTVQSAVSRKSHGSVGNFNVDLPLTGTAGIECRSGSATNDYTIVVAFLANISVNGNPQAAVTSGIGTIGSAGVSNGGMVTTDGNVVTISLTNVSNAQTINVVLNSVNGSTNVTIPMRVLIGDVSGNGTVNATDVAQTKLQVGQPVSLTNFRYDVNASGAISATDVSMLKSFSGIALP